MQDQIHGPVPISVYHISTPTFGRAEFLHSKARLVTSISVVTLLVVVSGVVVVQNAVIDRATFRMPAQPVSDGRATEIARSTRADAPSIPMTGENEEPWAEAAAPESKSGSASALTFASVGRQNVSIDAPLPHHAHVGVRDTGLTTPRETARNYTQEILTAEAREVAFYPEARSAAEVRSGGIPPKQTDAALQMSADSNPTVDWNLAGSSANFDAANSRPIAADPSPTHHASRSIKRRTPLLADMSENQRLSGIPAFIEKAETLHIASVAPGIKQDHNKPSLLADENAGQLSVGTVGELDLPSVNLADPESPLVLERSLEQDDERPGEGSDHSASSQARLSDATIFGGEIDDARTEIPSPVPSHVPAPGEPIGALEDDTPVSLAPSVEMAHDYAGTGNFRITTVSFEAGMSDPPARAERASGIVPLKRTAENVQYVRLGDLIGLLERQMDKPLFVWLKSSASASKYVTFDTLRSAGICVEYDPSLNHVTLSVPVSTGQCA